MYSLAGYGQMIIDRVRVDAYTEALRKTVRPGSVVLEMGTGPGIFAILAYRLGARRVYAVEPSEIIQVAREVADANGCADRIVFIEDLSTRINLPEKADVIVSDLRGVLPLFERHIPSVVDARRRFLAPGGTLIPRQDTLWAGVVEVPKSYGSAVDPWDNNLLGLDLSPARRLTVNNLWKLRVTPDQLLTKPALWATLDFATVESADMRGCVHWTVDRPGTGHGIIVWFDTELTEGVGFSNAPGAPEAIYASMFFPWAQPVSLAPGQTVTINLHAKLTEDDYMWRWTTEIASPHNPDTVVARFDQSQLAGAVISPGKLHKSASKYIPELSEDGIVERRALELMDGASTLEQIARKLTLEFPQRFTRWQDALSAAATLSKKYG